MRSRCRYASSLCGACYEVCPVKINIPEVLIHLRNKVVVQAGPFKAEALAMRGMAMIFRSERRFRAAQRLGRIAETPLGQRGWAGRGLDRLAAGLTGRLDPGARSARDAQADVSRVVRGSLFRRGRRKVSRAGVLGKIRAANGGATTLAAAQAAWEEIPRAYRRTAGMEQEEILEMLEDRLRDYDAHVVRATRADVPDTVAAMLRTRNRTRMLMPEGVDASLLPSWVGFAVDDPGEPLASGSHQQVRGRPDGVDAGHR